MKRFALAAACCILIFPTLSPATIYNWQTGEVIPGTETIIPAPGVDLSNWNADTHNLNYASLSSLDLTGGYFYNSWLNSADLAGADLTGAGFDEATLAGADFTDALITGARLENTTSGGFTKEQLYSTASYKSMDLSGIALGSNDLASWDFHGQNLSMADFSTFLGDGSNLAGANFAGANLTDARLSKTNLSSADLAGANLSRTEVRWADLTGADLRGANLTETDLENANLTGADLSAQNLTTAHLDYTTMNGTNLAGVNLVNAHLMFVDLTNANFTGAEVSGMNLFQTTGFTKEQLYSTASYGNKDLSAIWLQDHDLSTWDFHNQNLTDAYLAFTNLAGADFTGADLTNVALYGAELSDTDFTDAVINGARFGSMMGNNLSREQLYSTASYKSGNLDGVAFAPGTDLSGWDFHGQSLESANLHSAILAGADFTDAVVKGADFSSTMFIFAPGFTREQLYSTASYKNRNLRGIDLGGNTLDGWDFAGQSLIASSFAGCDLDGTDFTLADLRGASFASLTDTSIIHNTIWNDGMIADLQLADAEELWIRNYDMAITANGSWTMTQDAALKMVLEDGWLSVMNVGDGVTPDLGGILELSFADGADIASLIGTEFKLFNWNGRLTAGDGFDTIAAAPGAEWDTSRLYTDGIVTLTAVPEPITLSLLALGLPLLRRKRRSTGFQPVSFSVPRP